jgi:hypothetical protein
MLIITLVFKKNANLFAENWEKSQKIVIITSTADRGKVFGSKPRKCCCKNWLTLRCHCELKASSHKSIFIKPALLKLLLHQDGQMTTMDHAKSHLRSDHFFETAMKINCRLVVAGRAACPLESSLPRFESQSVPGSKSGGQSVTGRNLVMECRTNFDKSILLGRPWTEAHM